MLSTIFSPSIENSYVKKFVSHILSKMDYEKYRSLLSRVNQNPELTYKFVVFEYTHSTVDAPILQAEYVPGTRALIHDVINNSDFGLNMKRLFGDSICWYTRRKTDLSKPHDEQLTNIRQIVVVIEDDMPPLIPLDSARNENNIPLDSAQNENEMPGLISSATILNPEDENIAPHITFTNYINTPYGLHGWWNP